MKGPAGGFVFQRRKNKQGVEIGGLVPKVTLQSIAKNEDAGSRLVPDRPEVSRGVTRVSGPFTVEATIQAAMNIEEDAGVPDTVPQASSPRSYLDRMTEVLRQSKTLRLPGNVTLELDNVRPLAEREYLHAEGIAKNGGD